MAIASEVVSRSFVTLRNFVLNGKGSTSNLLLHIPTMFKYVQVIKRTENKVTPNRERVLQLAGSITDEEAEEVRKMINDESNQIDES